MLTSGRILELLHALNAELEREEVRGVDGHNKRHQGRLAFGKMSHH